MAFLDGNETGFDARFFLFSVSRIRRDTRSEKRAGIFRSPSLLCISNRTAYGVYSLIYLTRGDAVDPSRCYR